MIRLLAALFLVFSFAVSPAIADCCGSFTGNSSIEQSSVETPHNTPDDSGKQDLAVHHCASCCQQYAGDCSMPTELASVTAVNSAVFFGLNSLAPSFITGPLLEPPSHA